MNKKKDKDLDKEDLKAKIVENKRKLFSLRLKQSSHELGNTSEISKVKKEIARLFTELNRKK